MGGMSEVSLQHGMTRQMAVSQSMQTGMQILQASALELRQIIRQALETNPMLEELPDASPEALEDGPDGDAWNEREDGWNEFTAEGRLSGDAAARRDFMYESVVAPESLKTHLMDQAQHSALTGRARDALFLLIDALDERGFLTESPQELEEQGCFSMRDMEEALAALREMDPPGVGAANLRDSLLIQLEQRGLKRSLAFRLVKRCWRELAAHKYEEAARLLDVEPGAVAAALEVIRSLTPDPGGAYAPGGNPHLLPDVIVEEGPSGVLEVILTSEYLPRLSMNERYMELMAEGSGSRELRQYLRRAFREGQELLRALDMRQETVLRLARVIVRRQEDFFRSGPSRLEATRFAALVPMQVARNACELMEIIADVARLGNQNAITDACVAMMAARSAVLGALLNVRINLGSLKDKTFVDELKREADHLEQLACMREKELLEVVNQELNQ